MPAPASSPQERRLAALCRLLAVAYLLGALAFAAAPQLVYRSASFDGQGQPSAQTLFLRVLVAAGMAALATSCAVVAASPRERRHAFLPVVVAKLTASALAAAFLLRAHGHGATALLLLLATDVPLFVLTALVYRAAAPGVHSAPAREGPASPEAPQAPVKLGIASKS